MKSRALRWLVGVLAVLAALVAVRIAVALFTPIRNPPPPVATHGGDVYGDPIPEGATARLGTVRFRAKGPAVWAPDGDHLLVGGWNDEILGMSATTGLVDWTMPGHSEPIVRQPDVTDPEELWRIVKRGRLREIDDSLEGLTLFPDSGRLLTQGFSLRVWDLATRAEVRRIPLRGGNVWGAAVSPDGKLAACLWGDCVQFFDLEAGRQRLTFRVGSEKNPVACVAWSADGARVFAGLESGRVAVVPVDGGSNVSFPISECAIDALLVADGGRTLWALDHQGVVAIRSLASSDVAPRRIELGPPAADFRKVWWRGSLLASPDGRIVAASNGVGGVRCFDVVTAKPLEGPALEDVSPIGWSPDGRRFAGWSRGALRIVGADAPSQPDTISGRVAAVAWSPDGRHVATASTGRQRSMDVCAWDAQTGRRLWTFRADPSWWLASVAWTADGSKVVATSPSRIVGLDAATGARRWTYDVPAEKPAWPMLDVRGAGAIWVDEERELHFVDLRGGAREVGVAHLGTHPSKERPRGTPLPDVSGAVLLENVPTQVRANGSWSGRYRVRLWRIGDSKPAAEIDVPGQSVLAVSRDGRIAAAGDQIVAVLDLAATPPREIGRVRIQTLPSRHGPSGCTAAALSIDASLLALGAADGTISVFALPSLAEAKTLRGHRAGITSLAFSDDGERLCTGSEDGTALVWKLK